LTLVISPLRALQQDQVMQLTERGVAAACLNSDLGKRDRKELLAHLPELCLVYLAPEQLFTKDFQAALRRCHVERVVVDEAHVLPQAAPSFRKAYGQIKHFIQQLPYPPQIIACTATATPKERKTIIKYLGVDSPEVVTYPLRRDNLRLTVKKVSTPPRCKNKQAELENQLFHSVEAALLDWNGNGSAILYCPTVKRVKKLKKWLKSRGWKATAYTGKMSQKERMHAQEEFCRGSKNVIVATNAFGLGINKPNIRRIIHAGLPLTLSGYTQEIGRAGRDGKKAKCILFYTDSDFQRNERILKQSGNKKAVRQGLHGLNALKKLLDSSGCLWTRIEEYYGQTVGGPCGHCCRCKAKRLKA